MNAQRDAHRASAAGLGEVDFRLLGPLEAHVDGEPAALGPPKQRALLVHLLLRGNEPVPVARLVDSLWPTEPPASARHAIQVYVSALRNALRDPSRIEAHSRSYVLRVAPEESDLGRFRTLVGEAREALAATEAGRAAERLDEALALWRGPALADLNGEPGVRQLVRELQEEHLSALELRITAKLETGGDAELVPELEALIAEYPAREQLHADLLLALYRARRKDDALTVYERAREALLNELGLEPTAALSELAAAIRRDDPALAFEPPELRARRHLPAQPNLFVGRERELEELVELLVGRGQRIVTLTGAGGIGKTRLALATAGRLLAHFEDGVWFVDLAPLSSADDVPVAIGQALGIVQSPERSPQENVEAHLAEKELLLVVDNFEHVAAAAPLLVSLLEAAPGLTLLVTSRAALRLSQEEDYAVAPLGVPDAASADPAGVESVRLFAARARAVARRFELTDENVNDVAAICVALDGLPLAIELAGAASRRLAPAELRSELVRSLPVLVGGPVDAPARQQTIRATIDWSYGLLDPAERELFARLSVFAGGWSTEAAREVCDASEAALAALREQSLVQGGDERSWMLVAVREFAAEQLPETSAQRLAHAHASYFAALAQEYEARAHTSGRGDVELLSDVARDYENFRSALRWTRDSGEAELLARLADGLHQYWSVRGPYEEARTWLETALAAPVEDEHLRARVTYSLGVIAFRKGDFDRQRELLESALPVFRATGDRDLEASALGDLGIAYIWHAEYTKARQHLTASHALVREVGDELRLARLANVVGVLEMMEGNLEDAEPWLQESLERSRRVGQQEDEAFALANLAYVALETGRPDVAKAHYRASMLLAQRLDSGHHIAQCILGLAYVAQRTGNLLRAAHLLGSSDAVRDELGAELNPHDLAIVEKLRAAFGNDPAAAAAYDVGRSQTRSDALAYAATD